MPYKDKEKLYESQRKYRTAKKYKMWEYLLKNPCIDCGEKDPIVLDFDHTNPKEKKGNISSWVASSTRSWETILEEIAKCQIRCANCHRRKTHKENNFKTYTPL